MKLYFLIIIFIIIFLEKASSIIQPHTDSKEYYFGRNETSLKIIKNNMNIFALQAIMMNFLDQLFILNNHVNLEIITDHITELRNSIKNSELTEMKTEQFRSSIMKLLETNQIIKSWEHFRSHIIVDYELYVKEYLKIQYSDFRKLMYNIKDRRSFIKVIDIFTNVNVRKFDIIAIFMYWYDANTFYRNNLLASSSIKKALFERLVLEKPYWYSFFGESTTFKN